VYAACKAGTQPVEVHTSAAAQSALEAQGVRAAPAGHRHESVLGSQVVIGPQVGCWVQGAALSQNGVAARVLQ